MSAVVEIGRSHHRRLGLDSLVDRHEFMHPALAAGSTAWQADLLDDLILETLMRTNGACVILGFEAIEARFVAGGIIAEGRFYGDVSEDGSSPAAVVAGYALYLGTCRLVSHSVEPPGRKAWIFANGASLRSAMGLPFRGSLHFPD